MTTTAPPPVATTVRHNHALAVVRRLYPDARDVTVAQAFKDQWELLTPGGIGVSLVRLARLHRDGYTAVQFRVVTTAGDVRFPDYQMAELATPFRWEPFDRLRVAVNQGSRPATVLAVLGDEALIEYTMPAGTTALWVIRADCPTPGCVRTVSYARCPKKWHAAMAAAEAEWAGTGQPR